MPVLKAFSNMDQASVLLHTDATTLLPFQWDNFHSVSSETGFKFIAVLLPLLPKH